MQPSISRSALRVLVGVLLALSSSSVALAQGPAATPASASAPVVDDPARQARGDCAAARAAGRVCVLSIEGEAVSGGIVRPEGDRGAARLFEQLGSLFRPRRDFIQQILATTLDAP